MCEQKAPQCPNAARTAEKKKQKYSKTTENVFNISTNTNGCYCSPRAGPTQDAVNMETNAEHVRPVDAGVPGCIPGMKTCMHRLLAP